MTTSNSFIHRVLGQLCQISASLGGLVLVSLALMTLASVIGRAFFSSPIQGDIELVQLGCAVCVACFLPYTQFQRANIIVDFFTDKCSDKTKQFLDGFGALLIGLCFSVLAWRLAVGGLINKENGVFVLVSSFDTGEVSKFLTVYFFKLNPSLFNIRILREKCKI
jgi:TRAP-type mannitol/chloroaromatic compound transport system permease small subunit